MTPPRLLQCNSKRGCTSNAHAVCKGNCGEGKHYRRPSLSCSGRSRGRIAEDRAPPASPRQRSSHRVQHPRCPRARVGRSREWPQDDTPRPARALELDGRTRQPRARHVKEWTKRLVPLLAKADRPARRWSGDSLPAVLDVIARIQHELVGRALAGALWGDCRAGQRTGASSTAPPPPYRCVKTNTPFLLATITSVLPSLLRSPVVTCVPTPLSSSMRCGMNSAPPLPSRFN